MKNEPTAVAAQTSPMLSRLAIFGAPPLLAGEDAAAYDDLLARVSASLKPRDIFEEIWMREIVDLTWEAQRWRRYQTSLIKAAIPEVLEKVLKPLASTPVPGVGSFVAQMQARVQAQNAVPKLAAEWVAGDAAALKRVEELLTAAGLTIDDMVTRAVAQELEKIERFNRLLASAEWRRNTVLREVDRRRSSFAEKLRREIPKIEATECKFIEADITAGTGRATSVAPTVDTEAAYNLAATAPASPPVEKVQIITTAAANENVYSVAEKAA